MGSGVPSYPGNFWPGLAPHLSCTVSSLPYVFKLTSRAMFVQLHALTSYPASLLNRDDTGFAKRLPFGGDVRTRVSSQCLKYHWRNFSGKHSLSELEGIDRSIRSRETFTRRIYQPLVDAGYPSSLVQGATLAVLDLVLTGDTPTKTDMKAAVSAVSDSEVSDLLDTNQVVVLGHPEVRYLRSVARDVLDDLEETFPALYENGADGRGTIEDPPSDKELSDAILGSDRLSSSTLRNNLSALERASGTSAALFGRMATSDVLARGESAVHVAHSFTTHPQEAETDYFSAVDELRRDDDTINGTGSAHINTQDLTSGLFYSYVSIDLPQLVSNLEGCPPSDWKSADHALASEVIQRFPHLMSTVSPGAKKGSTAPYSYAHFLLAEVGEEQPRTLANAFQSAVRTDGVLQRSYQSLEDHVQQLDFMYSAPERKVAAMDAPDSLLQTLGTDDPVSVEDLSAWLPTATSLSQ